MGAKKILIFLGIASIALFLGLGTNLLARQQAKTAEQEKTKAAEQQKPPVRQKVRPADLQKPKTIKEASLSEHYKDWLTQDVVYIITDEERSVFLALTTDEERENFIEQFWARRNTDPREGSNEFKIEHYRRIAYANAPTYCSGNRTAKNPIRAAATTTGSSGKEAAIRRSTRLSAGATGTSTTSGMTSNSSLWTRHSPMNTGWP